MSRGALVIDLVVLAAIVFVIDAGFLYAMRDTFSRQVMLVQGSALRMNTLAAGLCYAIIIFGLYYFVVRHVIVPNAGGAAAIAQTLRLKDGIQQAFLLGLFAYGVYETTTMALLKNWQWSTVAVDTFWGGTLFAVSTYLFYLYKSSDL